MSKMIYHKDAFLKQINSDLKFISLRLDEMRQNNDVRKLKKFTDRCLNEYSELHFEE